MMTSASVATPPTTTPRKVSQEPRTEPSTSRAPFARLLAATLGTKVPAAPARPLGSLDPAKPTLHAGSAAGSAHAHGSAIDAQARRARDEDRRSDVSDDGAPKPGTLDVLDPSVRSAAQLAPPILPMEAAAPIDRASGGEVGSRARVSMEELLPVLVKRIAWAGDRRRGAVQLELGAGAYAGATVTVHAEGRRVRLELAGACSADLDALRSRVESRLRAAGLDVETSA